MISPAVLRTLPAGQGGNTQLCKSSGERDAGRSGGPWCDPAVPGIRYLESKARGPGLQGEKEPVCDHP